MTQQDDLPRAQKLWALAAAILFLIAVGFLGFAFNTGIMLSFAVGWLLLQIFGFAARLNSRKRLHPPAIQDAGDAAPHRADAASGGH